MTGKVRMTGKGVLFLISLLVILTACSSDPTPQPTPESNVFRIVSSLPKKGSAAYESDLMRQAIDLAVRERGRIAGRAVEHLALDGGSEENGKWSPRIEGDNAARAANDSQAIAYVGPYTSGATGVALPITNRAQLLTLGPTATWPGLTLGGWEQGEPEKYYPTNERNYARLAQPDSRQGEAAARWAAALGTKRVFALHDGSTYSAGLAAAFVTAAKERGLSVVGEEMLAQGKESEVAARLAANPDAIFFAPSNTGSAVSLANLLWAAQSRAAVFVSDTALNDQLLELAGDKVGNWHFIYNGAEASASNPKWAGFSERFRAAYNVQPTFAAARAYDLANLALDAAAAAYAANPNAGRVEITRRVLSTRNYKGTSGLISFDGAGDTVASRLTGYKVEGGRFVVERVIEW
jgi:branched-chain amino acid transport system substrate-binding protein